MAAQRQLAVEVRHFVGTSVNKGAEGDRAPFRGISSLTRPVPGHARTARRENQAGVVLKGRLRLARNIRRRATPLRFCFRCQPDPMFEMPLHCFSTH